MRVCAKCDTIERLRLKDNCRRYIADEQNINVNKLVALVKENESILVKMRVRVIHLEACLMMHNSALNLLVLSQENLRWRIVQDVITIVIKSDKNNDQSIDRVEAKILALQICQLLQENYGVEFNSDKFLLAIRQNPSISCVTAIAQRLLTSDTDDKSDTSEDDNDLYDMICMGDECLNKWVSQSGFTDNY